MTTETDIRNLEEKIFKSQMEKLKNELKNTGNCDDFVYESLKKIFRKLAFPYFRFEILRSCIEDVLSKTSNDFEINNNAKKKFKNLQHYLKKICIYLNLALENFYDLLLILDKQI